MPSNSGPFASIAVKHFINDSGDTVLKLLDRRDENAGISRRRTRACCSPSICVTNCGKHYLIELLPPRAARHLGLESISVRKHAMHVGVAEAWAMAVPDKWAR